MKKAVGIFLAIVVVGLYALYWKTPSEINPDAPETTQVSVPPWTSTSTSMIGVDVLISKSAIESLVNRLVPTKEKDSKKIQITKLLSEDKVSWDFKRGDISVSTNKNLQAQTQIDGTIRVSGEVFRRDVSQHARLKGGLTVAASPVLTGTWRLNPNISARLDINKAKLTLAKIATLSVRSLASKAITPKVNEQVRRLNTRISSAPFLEEALNEIYNELCQVSVIEDDNVSAWIRTRPTEWLAEQPVFNPDGLSLKLRLTLETTSGLAEPPNNSECPFPNILNIRDFDDPGSISIKLASSLDWASLQEAVNKQLLDLTNNEEVIFQNSYGSLEMVDLSITELKADGASVLMKVSFEGSLSSWWSRDFSGHVWLKAQPDFDRANQSISFADVEIDLASEEALSGLSTFGLVAGPMLEKKFGQLSVINLEQSGRTVSALANEAINNISKDLNGLDIAILSEPITETQLEDLHVSEQGLEILISAEGNLSIQIDQIELD